jgi:polyisoprenoid-binding protein YceI
MRRRRQQLCAVALLCALPLVALGALSASEAKVGFICIGPGGLHINGTGDELLFHDSPDTLVVTVPLAKLTTGISLRDSHMHEKYLESDKYPLAELSVPRQGVKFPGEGESVESSSPGTLTLHGKSQAVTFHYKAVRKGNATFQVEGGVRINMNDYGIATPSYLGITVKPEVDITVTFRLLES